MLDWAEGIYIHFVYRHSVSTAIVAAVKSELLSGRAGKRTRWHLAPMPSWRDLQDAMTTPFRVYSGPIPPRRTHPRRILLAVLAAVFLVVVLIPWLASFATDWLWFKEIHFESVFVTSLVARVMLFVVTALVAFGFVYGNLRLASRGVDLPT